MFRVILMLIINAINDVLGKAETKLVDRARFKLRSDYYWLCGSSFAGLLIHLTAFDGILLK